MATALMGPWKKNKKRGREREKKMQHKKRKK